MRGWTFARFQALKPQEQSVSVAGITGARYVLEIDVIDRSGDYDPKDEWLELEFTLYEARRRSIWRRRAYVRASAALQSGELFSGEPGEIVRRTGWTELGGLLLLGGLAAGGLLAVAYYVLL